MKKLASAVSFAAVIGLSFWVTQSWIDSRTGEAGIESAAYETRAEPQQAVPGVVNEGVTAKQDEADAEIAGAVGAFSPFGDNLGGDFDLIDHFGNPRQMEDFRGKHVLIFFGYANCQAICSAALPLMGDAISMVSEDHPDELVPLMITVDPENDTPTYMREKLAEFHPTLLGMTGSDGALADVRDKFNIRVENVGTDIEGNPVITHGSFIYLMDKEGKFATLMPPILDPNQMAGIIRKYLAGSDKASGNG